MLTIPPNKIHIGAQDTIISDTLNKVRPMEIVCNLSVNYRIGTPLVEMMYLAGGDPNALDLKVNNVNHANETVDQYLKKIRSHPRTLLHLCRLKLRKVLGSGCIFFKKCNLLPIPEKMKTFLKIPEMKPLLEELETWLDNISDN